MQEHTVSLTNPISKFAQPCDETTPAPCPPSGRYLQGVAAGARNRQRLLRTCRRPVGGDSRAAYLLTVELAKGAHGGAPGGTGGVYR